MVIASVRDQEDTNQVNPKGIYICTAKDEWQPVPCPVASRPSPVQSNPSEQHLSRRIPHAMLSTLHSGLFNLSRLGWVLVGSHPLRIFWNNHLLIRFHAGRYHESIGIRYALIVAVVHDDVRVGLSVLAPVDIMIFESQVSAAKVTGAKAVGLGSNQAKPSEEVEENGGFHGGW